MPAWFETFFDRHYLEILAAQKPVAVTRAEVDFVVRALGLERGQRILDLGCGFGRHAAELARRGFEVVGLDLSQAMIREARRRFAARPRLTFVRADMRALAYVREFDAVLSMFNAFGYFSPRENDRVLGAMARALVPGGRVLIEHRNAAWDARHFAGQAWWRAPRGGFVLQSGSFDRKRGIASFEWRLIGPGRRRARPRVATVREFDAAGWRSLLRRAGLKVTRACAGFAGGRLRAESGPRLIVVAQRLPQKPR